MTFDNCEACQEALFDLADNTLAANDRKAVEAHLSGCDECQDAFNGIWNMQRAASQWQDQVPPRWNQRALFFGERDFSFLGGFQWATSLASVLVLVLVMTEARISTTDGLTISFGGQENIVTVEQLNAAIGNLENRQDTSLVNFTDRQVATNQLLLRTLLETSREERRDDLETMLVALQDAQAQREMTTEESLRYLFASQRRDREEIEELSNALLQVNTNRNY